MSEICLLPGPVTLSSAVRTAMQQPVLYHRGSEFLALFDRVRRQLSDLVGGRDVALFPGSGTVANDVVAATLAAGSATRGLILENGEFGRRLVAQARRFGLEPRVLSWPWGCPWNLDEIASALDEAVPGSWVWGVHHETSTGLLNDLAGLIRLAKSRGVRVCLDAVSSIGGQPLDLSEVFLSTGTSGKALGACSGIALVFGDRDELDNSNSARVPTSLDLVASLNHAGPRFTFPSPPLQALAAALQCYDSSAKATERFHDYTALGCFVRRELRGLGLAPLAEDSHASSTVTTFAVPDGGDSDGFVERCQRAGFLIGGQSAYLAERRLVQIATMGAVTQADCRAFFESLAQFA
ncbi:MAG: alanine--glyoxylate aminotransferase family protein [Planctomycetes bacterium]|nr:alanine--glyoxylate aminotransferase family protein [Planctomycetota bacterium]